MEDRDEFDALGYLQAVYRGKVIAETQRMKAAIEALPFERPKLGAVAHSYSFASQMEDLARLTRPGGNVIDAKRSALNMGEDDLRKTTEGERL